MDDLKKETWAKATTGTGAFEMERGRQKSFEGFTPEHDGQHKNGELAIAAACYAEAAAIQAICLRRIGSAERAMRKIPKQWPWEPRWWKPSPDPKRNLEKAGALLAAEWDRLERKRLRDAAPLSVTEPAACPLKLQNGYQCSRAKGHSGPCADMPDRPDIAGTCANCGQPIYVLSGGNRCLNFDCSRH